MILLLLGGVERHGARGLATLGEGGKGCGLRW